MYCEPTLATDPSTTISKRPATLAALPLPSEVSFPGLFAWSPISTSALTAALNLDRGLFATWRCRGIGPTELPTSWFKPTTGRPNYYLVSDVLAWLAARRSEPFDLHQAWYEYLAALGLPADLVWVRRLAKSAGPIVGDCRFTPAGFQAYLASL